MNEEDLNIKYIREKTGLVENDELIPIILEMIQESYKAGLCQVEYDNIMDLIEENEQLKEVIDKAKKLHNEFASKNSLLVFENNNLIDFMNNLISVLKEVEDK